MKRLKTIKTALILGMMVLATTNTMAQTEPPPPPVQQEQEIIGGEPEIFVVVEYMPQFPGGQDSMVKFIQEHLVYPALAQENNIQGKVVVQFVVDENGKITNVKAVTKPLGWGLDEAAVAVVKKMPNWTPGKQRGKPVKVRYVLPIRFQLTNPEVKPKEGN